MNSETFIESMNEKYFEGDLSPTQIKFLGELDINNKEAVDFVEKAFARVSRMNVSAKDCAAFIIWEMASIWPKILTGGLGRHRSSNYFSQSSRAVGRLYGKKSMVSPESRVIMFSTWAVVFHH